MDFNNFIILHEYCHLTAYDFHWKKMHDGKRYVDLIKFCSEIVRICCVGLIVKTNVSMTKKKNAILISWDWSTFHRVQSEHSEEKDERDRTWYWILTSSNLSSGYTYDATSIRRRSTVVRRRTTVERPSNRSRIIVVTTALIVVMWREIESNDNVHHRCISATSNMYTVSKKKRSST